MSFYDIKARGRSVGLLETNNKRIVKKATVSYAWAVGLRLSVVSEWCHRKQLTVEPITDPRAKSLALASLNPQLRLIS